MTLKTPWTLIDPDGASGGILARIVTDLEMGHVAVFESPETARIVVETMNRAESLEQERGELEREFAETREKLEEYDCFLVAALGKLGDEQRAHAETRAQLNQSDSEARRLRAAIGADGEHPCTPAERAVLDAWPENKVAIENLLQLWADFSSQEMYGELFMDGMEPSDHQLLVETIDRLRELARRGEKP